VWEETVIHLYQWNVGKAWDVYKGIALSLLSSSQSFEEANWHESYRHKKMSFAKTRVSLEAYPSALELPDENPVLDGTLTVGL
jgi:hypothetical protein